MGHTTVHSLNIVGADLIRGMLLFRNVTVNIIRRMLHCFYIESDVTFGVLLLLNLRDNTFRKMLQCC